MKPLTIFIVFILFLSSCKKEKEAGNPYVDCPYGKTFVPMTDPSVKSEGLIPLTLNNGWIYADSTWLNGILVSTGIDTVSVISAEVSGNDIWWGLNDGTKLCGSPDTVYKLNFNGEVPIGTTSCPEKTLLFFNVPADTTINWTEWTSDYGTHGEAAVHPGIIHTGIGNLANCLAFKQGLFTRYIKPGIGIIKTSREIDNQLSVRTLISYSYK